jgi:cytochrome P450
MTSSSSVGVDLLSAEMQQDPHAALHALRDSDPVHWSERHRAVLLTRYDDVAAAFRDPSLSADRMTPMFERLEPEARKAVELAERHLTRWLVFMDPPAHDRLRRLVSRAFTPPRMDALRPIARAIVHQLLDAWPASGAVSFAETFSFPLPSAVVAAVLGVPVGDRDRFAAWSTDVAAVVFGGGSGRDASHFARAQRGLEEFDAYIRAMVDDVRRSSSAPGGLVADLVAVHDEGDRLDIDELVATCTLLLFAGHETTTTLLGNSMVVLDGMPERTIDATAVEELLRVAGPTRAMVRQAVDDVVLPSGGRIERGQRVFLLVVAANRDPARFPEPDRVDLARRDNAHLGFGSGIHHCLGALLARVEAQEALGAIFERFPRVSLAGEARWRGGLLGYSAGPVRVATG